MQVDRHVMGLCRGKNIPEFAVGQVLALGMRVDDDGIHTQAGHAAFDLQSGRRRVLRRHGDHAGKTCGVATHRFSQFIVGHPAEGHRRFLVHHLHTGRRERNHLPVNTGFVHMLQADLVEVLQTTHDVLGSRARAAHVKTHQALKARIDVGFGQNFPVDVEHLRRCKGLFGGDALIGGAGLRWRRCHGGGSLARGQCYKWKPG